MQLQSFYRHTKKNCPLKLNLNIFMFKIKNKMKTSFNEEIKRMFKMKDDAFRFRILNKAKKLLCRTNSYV